MPALPVARPEAIGFDPARLQRAFDLLQRWTDADKVLGAGICVGRRGRMVEPRFFGRLHPEAKTPLPKNALFLIASPSKPITVAAVMLLVERGEVALTDKVTRFVPRFGANGKGDVEILHLMTHTSGLPDMVPNNEKLRKSHSPLSAFVDETCTVPLLFPPGTKVSYQSMGTLMLAEIVHQVTGVTVAEFLRREVFVPLGMEDTSLGMKPAQKARVAGVRTAPELLTADWHWNSDYWRGLGAPWGGLIASPSDYARLCQAMLNGGELDGVRVFSPATIRAMSSNQLVCQPQVPEEDRRCRPWGLGWRLNWPGNASSFGDLLGPRAFGHWGATGTMVWMDPDAEAFCVLLTTEPKADSERWLARVSNLVAAAWK